MKEQLLIAESGGTKTDWVLIEDNRIVLTFTSGSFHPRSISTSIESHDFKKIIASLDSSNTKLYFFGAGCHNADQANDVLQKFEQFNFKQVEVKSDLVAAALALHKGNPGWVAILGTGSVLCYFDGESITELKGGLGYILGDEGSGFYFGKLLVEAYLNGELNKEQQLVLSSILVDRSTVLSKVYSHEGVAFISGLAKKVGELPVQLFEEIHEKNLEEFKSKYITKHIKEMGIVGSYAKSTEVTIRRIFHPVHIQQIIERPIHDLTEYFLRATF